MYTITKKTIFLFLSLFATTILIFTLLSCGNNSTATDNKAKDSNTLNISLNGSPNTLDPQASSATIITQVNSSIYDTLVYSPDANPGLAEKWEVSEDQLIWTFYLRDNVFFHHGKLLDAQDVIATFERLRDPALQSPFVDSINNIVEIQPDEGDPLIVRFVLEVPDPNMPIILGAWHMAILPSDLIEQGHDFSTQPVGTGPFSFVEWEKDKKIALKKNTNYFGINHNIEELNFYIISDINSQMQALNRGDIDVIPYIIDPERSILEKDENINIQVFQGATILLLAMNTRIEPFSSLEFRKAIAQVINKDEVINIAYPSSQKTNVFWHKDNRYYTDIPEIYDFEAGKKYFEELGEIRPLNINVPSNFPPHVKAAQVYQAQLKKAGLEVDVTPVSWATWLNEVYGKGDFDMTVIGHTGKLSPYQRLKGFAENGGYIGWQNEDFKRIMEEIENDETQENTDKLYQEAFKILTEDYPFIFVAQNAVNIAIRKGIENIEFDPILETYNFRNVKINSSK